MPMIYTHSITFHCCVSCLRGIFWCLQAATENLRPSRLCLVRPWAWTSRCGVPRGPRLRGSKRFFCFQTCLYLILLFREFSASNSAMIKSKISSPTNSASSSSCRSFTWKQCSLRMPSRLRANHFCGLEILKSQNLEIYSSRSSIQVPGGLLGSSKAPWSNSTTKMAQNGIDFSWRQGFAFWDEPRIVWHYDTACNHKVTMTCAHRLSQLILQLALIFAVIPLLPQHNLQVQIKVILTKHKSTCILYTNLDTEAWDNKQAQRIPTATTWWVIFCGLDLYRWDVFKAKAVGEKSATSPRQHSEDAAGSIETSGEVRAWLRSNATYADVCRVCRYHL